MEESFVLESNRVSHGLGLFSLVRRNEAVGWFSSSALMLNRGIRKHSITRLVSILLRDIGLSLNKTFYSKVFDFFSITETISISIIGIFLHLLWLQFILPLSRQL